MNTLAITSSPHFRATKSTRVLMRDVLIALAPALVAAVVIFGARALVLTAVCAAACILFEYLYRKLMHLPNTAADLSAAVTGVLIAFNLPVGMPLWMAVIGCFAAIVIIKQLFGGLGKNFANPAIVARIVLLISFATPMTTWVLPTNSVTPDVTTGATPLAVQASLSDVATGATAAQQLPGYFDMFIGRIGGSMGETCTIALLLGGIYLVARGVITVTTPLAFIGTTFVLSWMLGADPVFHILAGGVMLGAIFMATDYVTSPTTERGKLIFGIGCGLITVIIRLYGSYPEGVSFALLIMNIVTPHIDRLTSIKAFGGAPAK